MANRNVYGNTISENGWPMVDEGSCQWVGVPGTDVSLEIQKGQPTQILQAFAADFNVHVQPLRDADSACWTETNSVDTSNHLSGTAIDLDWDDHPMGNEYAGYSQDQIAAVRDLLAFYEDTVFWGNDWDSPKDSMHYQMGYDTYQNPKTADFIARKIRADGYSTYQRDVAPTPAPAPAPVPDSNTAQMLSVLMGAELTLDHYQTLLPDVAESLQDCQCTNVNRIAMWVAQIGHESGGLYYTEEIADGSAYEGRTDLGNTQPGDGERFKGRSWIQITGRSNYTALSTWAFSKALVPTVTYFVDNPEALAEDQYAGLGAAWYWIVARPDINSLSDARDIVTVTERINGGTNSLDDRTTRYNRALSMGDQLLALLPAVAPIDEENPLAALTEDEQHELLDGVRWLKDQLGPSIWGPTSSFGTDASGAELTLRDGLAALKRDVEDPKVAIVTFQEATK